MSRENLLNNNEVDMTKIKDFSDDIFLEILQAEKRMAASDVGYFPVYPGGQKQFNLDCMTLCVAYLVIRGIKRVT
jgi:hypothetical protein